MLLIQDLQPQPHDREISPFRSTNQKQKGEDSIEIRIVSSESDRRDIYRFRYQVYVEEMRRTQFWADHKAKMIKDPHDENAIVIGAFSDTKIIGTCRLNFSENSHFDHRNLYDFDRLEDLYMNKVAFVSKLMLDPRYRRTSLFFKIVRYVYMVAFLKGSLAAVLDCNDHLVSTFKKLGFKEYKEKIIHPEYGFVTPMILDMYDIHHMRAMKSPFQDIFLFLNQTPTTNRNQNL